MAFPPIFWCSMLKWRVEVEYQQLQKKKKKKDWEHSSLMLAGVNGEVSVRSGLHTEVK